jgi:photosystem II stability/assembly factor-like uncharacterized protein
MRRNRLNLARAAVLMVLIISGLDSMFGAGLPYWYNIGPSPINGLDADHNVVDRYAGRVPALAVDPSNANHWLLGAAQGGIWQTSDGGNTWSPRTDDQASLAIGAIVFAPSAPTLVYAGTGEANFRGDDYAGAGLLRSQDGGTLWHMLNSSFAKTSFSHIRVDPSDSNKLVLSTVRGGAGVGEESSGHGNVPGAPPRGVFISSDGGTNFTRIITGEATALEVSPSNFSDQYAGLGEIYGDPTNGVYRTTNGWATYELISGPWLVTNISYTYTNYPIATNIFMTNGMTVTNIIYTNYATSTNIEKSVGGRVTIAGSPSDPNILYVGLAEMRSAYLADLRGIWKTTNAWADEPSWSEVPSPPFEIDDISLPRFWYMFDLLVDPNSPSVIYLAEFEVWRYSGSWTSVGEWGDHVHPDNHVMTWVPQGGSNYRMLLGNDGGVYLSDVGVSGAWTNFNSRLSITQFYKGAVDPTGGNVLALGGAQDQFTSSYTGDTEWTKIGGGDGGDCAISASDPLNDWVISHDTPTDYPVGYNDAAILRTRNGGQDFSDGGSGINDVPPISQQFYVHFEKAPNNDDLLIAGTTRLWRCNNFFSGTTPTWTPNGPTMLDTNGAPIPLSAMAFAPSDTNGLVYAFGTEDGQLQATFNGGANWKNLDPADVLPNRYVSGLAFSPTNPNILYVTFSGFDESTPGHPGHLFKTSNAFVSTPTWTDISPPVNLPNNCLAIDPGGPETIYVGTDIGIWITFNGGTSWSHHGPGLGMPNVAVYDLRFDRSSKITAFTHGRGAFLLSEIDLPIIVFVWPDFHLTPNCLTCPPDKIWINPGDEVSFEIRLRNILPVDTRDLRATLLPSASITPITGTQDYGVVKGQGAPVSRVFKFIAAGQNDGPGSLTCGDTVEAVLKLQDQGVDLGQVKIPFRLGVPSHPLVEDSEEGPPPILPPGWTSASSGFGVPWETTTNQPPNLPEVGEDEFPTTPPSNTSLIVLDTAGVGQSLLMSPPFKVATSNAQLYFRTAFNVSNKFDGGLLEIAIANQPFQDIIQAGGSFVKDGYNTVLDDHNPLGLRPAWSGDSGGWLPVIVNLPPGAAGQFAQLRWHFATSRGMPDGAWFIDSVFVTEPNCLPPVSNPVILNPALKGNFFTFAIDTVSNRNYVIEYKTDLMESVWQTLQILPGNGSRQTIQVPIDFQSRRFYRFHLQ